MEITYTSSQRPGDMMSYVRSELERTQVQLNKVLKRKEKLISIQKQIERTEQALQDELPICQN